ncbi:autotransporter outer membrane beta-barrel domain-containing protein [Variovorax sp. M-6]|uniref:autotransporter outer membrane beta-barrel domain-containing protein n=1 Tax=Variovorax sp. M-6 TaxID=3233041 RepID=UPI003F9A1C1B
MNRVFSVVWNSSLQIWAVASELASGAGKSATRSVRLPSSPNARPFQRIATLQVAMAAALLGFGGAAAAACSTSGAVITCAAGSPQGVTVGSGPATASDTSVIVESGALISTGAQAAISIGSQSSIEIRNGATVENVAPVGADGFYGVGTGANTIEMHSNNTLTIGQGAKVLSKGDSWTAEAINPFGTGNLIVNNGEIRSSAGGAAIWFQAASGENTIVNGATGVIEYTGGSRNIMGVTGTMAITFTNRGQVLGSLNFADGNDTLNVYDGSSITGAINGGGGSNTLTLNGTGAGTFDQPFSNFQTLVKNDSGTWTLNNALPTSGITSTRVAGGTLILGADASSYTGSMTVDAAGTLQTSAGFAPLAITDNGLVRFAQPTDASYNGLLAGSGGIEKTGAGTLTLTRAQAITGTTTIAAGTLRAAAANVFSAASAHTVAAGATLDTGGFDQSVASLRNAGTVSLLSAKAGSTLTVNGAYVGNGGVLSLGTVLGASGSASDRLVLNGASASASGSTTVRVTNLGGLGGLTVGNGIELVSAQNGATTTAQTTRDAFALAGGHVDAGAFEYRLYAADATGAGENWYLRSTTTAPKVLPVPPVLENTGSGQAQQPVVVPTYRAEVPLFAALPAQLRQADLTMLGNLHRRVGDELAPAAAASAGDPAGGRQAWARAVYSDLDIRQEGVAAAHSQGHVSGVQAGTDLLATGGWRAGIYVGTLDGNADVVGNARGLVAAVGSNDLQSRYLGGYATWMGADGLYADAVLQGGRHSYTVQPQGNLNAEGKSNSLTASIEAGKSFVLAEGWTIEPQAQLIYQRNRFDDVLIGGARVSQDADGGWIGRLGVRIKGDVATAAGRLQPYGRVNVYQAGSGTDVATFIGPAASTRIASATGYTSTELAAGMTLALTPTATLYGEVGQLYNTGGDAKVKSSLQGSIGMRLSW